MEEFRESNADTPELLAMVEGLNPRSILEEGGGAAPLVRIVRPQFTADPVLCERDQEHGTMNAIADLCQRLQVELGPAQDGDVSTCECGAKVRREAGGSWVHPGRCSAHPEIEPDAVWVPVKVEAPAVQDDAGDETQEEREVLAIARRHLGLQTLAVRGSDSLDFHDLGVAGIGDALREAYRSGQDSERGEDDWQAVDPITDHAAVGHREAVHAHLEGSSVVLRVRRDPEAGPGPGGEWIVQYSMDGEPVEARTYYSGGEEDDDREDAEGTALAMRLEAEGQGHRVKVHGVRPGGHALGGRAAARTFRPFGTERTS